MLIFQDLLQNGALLLDVRTKQEFQSGHPKNAVNIPLDQLGNSLSKLKKDRSIVTVCQSGMRSRSAASFLKSKGYTVYNGGCWFNFK